MHNFFIIHGSDGYPEENWFPWLSDKLSEEGQKVFVPQFPTQDGHRLEKWRAKLEEYAEYVNEKTIFVAHSRGCAFVWRILESLGKPISAAFLVGGFSEYLWYPKPDNSVDSFFEKPFDWKKIKANCPYFKVYLSDNDPYVPVDEGEKIAQFLGIKVSLIKNAGHFNTESGFNTFPQLLDDIKDYLQSESSH